MKYIKVLDNQNRIYPYSDSQFRRDNANVSFPSTISDEIKASYQVYPVIEMPIPAYNEYTQNVSRQQPQLVNNQWVVEWVVVDKTEEEYNLYKQNQISKIKKESRRRIFEIAPEWKQLNLLARSTELIKIGEQNWTAAEQDEVILIETTWNKIKHIRSKSDQLELMNPIPEDFTNDEYWR